jgi:hypothetical protein
LLSFGQSTVVFPPLAATLPGAPPEPTVMVHTSPAVTVRKRCS